MNIKNLVKEKLRKSSNPLDAPPTFLGLREDALISFEKDLGFTIPKELKEWLRFSNGSYEAEGIYGVFNPSDFLDIKTKFSYYPNWLADKWIPIASDGCGNTYIINADKKSNSYGFTFFIEGFTPDKLEYATSSNLWRLLYFLLELDHRKGKTFFNKKYILSIDPDIEQVEGVILPWEKNETT